MRACQTSSKAELGRQGEFLIKKSCHVFRVTAVKDSDVALTKAKRTLFKEQP